MHTRRRITFSFPFAAILYACGGGDMDQPEESNTLTIPQNEFVGLTNDQGNAVAIYSNDENGNAGASSLIRFLDGRELVLTSYKAANRTNQDIRIVNLTDRFQSSVVQLAPGVFSAIQTDFEGNILNSYLFWMEGNRFYSGRGMSVNDIYTQAVYDTQDVTEFFATASKNIDQYFVRGSRTSSSLMGSWPRITFKSAYAQSLEDEIRRDLKQALVAAVLTGLALSILPNPVAPLIALVAIVVAGVGTLAVNGGLRRITDRILQEISIRIREILVNNISIRYIEQANCGDPPVDILISRDLPFNSDGTVSISAPSGIFNLPLPGQLTAVTRVPEGQGVTETSFAASVTAAGVVRGTGVFAYSPIPPNTFSCNGNFTLAGTWSQSVRVPLSNGTTGSIRLRGA